jgi:hypothetical protein
MNKLKVVKLDAEGIEFENGVKLYSYHGQSCCEYHYLSFSDLTFDDFKDLEFDLTNDNFFRRITGYGIELLPIYGHSVKVPGYGSNNGYYSSNIDLIVTDGKDFKKEYDITECQDWSYD